jgi:hypothetical protein
MQTFKYAFTDFDRFARTGVKSPLKARLKMPG